MAYFDRMYAVPDPWGYESSWYERRKYDVTLAALPRPRYRRAFEPGCSIGVLTERLAERCDELVAADLHPATAERARQRLAGCAHVRVEEQAVPGWWPGGRFDLIVLSEVAYYLGDEDHDRLVELVAASIEPDGDLVLVHWRGTTDYPQTGDAVHERWRADGRFAGLVAHVEDEVRLDVLRRRGGPAR
jgi:cyclopropane fatty-acyl-phospholipid synthase-like methyltransferase